MLMHYVCMTAEIKGLQTLCHDRDETFITSGYINWRMQKKKKKIRVHEESDLDFVKQLSPPKTVCNVHESFSETIEKARILQIFSTILRNVQFLSH